MVKVLVVGGGYAGFYTAWGLERRLRRDEAEVTVVDPRPYMTYQPFLPEVAAGSVEARFAAVSLRSHLHRTRIIAGAVTSIDHAARTAYVRTPDDELTVTYDVIVVTAGAVTRTLPIAGVAGHGIGLKHVEEAVAVRDRLLVAFDRASGLPAGPERQRLLTVTVVGGGFTGVEGFGELLSLATSLLERYPELGFEDLRFHLVEASDRILPEVSQQPGEWVVRSLQRRGGRVHLNTFLLSAEDGHVVLSDGEEFDAGLIVWTAGNAANPVVATHTDLPVNARGQVVVRADLRIGTDAEPVPDAWAAGDNAAVPDLSVDRPGALTVPNAQHAVRQGRLLARNIVATLRGREPKPYVHHNLGVVATLGLGRGIFQSGPIVVKGFPAWVMHRGYHALAVPTWERKIRVLLGWLPPLVFGRDIVSEDQRREPAAGLRTRHRVPAVRPAPARRLRGRCRAGALTVLARWNRRPPTDRLGVGSPPPSHGRWPTPVIVPDRAGWPGEWPSIAPVSDPAAESSLDDAADTFAAVRPRLFGIAYRMLGSWTEAEDVVQDAWLRWQHTDRTVVQNPGAFLATTTTRLALNVAQSARSRRETYIGPWLPEPVDTRADPTIGAERDEAVELAVLFLLEKLNPTERAAYILRESFAYSYAEIADILVTSQANVRQLVSRARKHLATGRREPVDAATHQRLLGAFLRAAQDGDLAALERLLAADVVSYTDGNGARQAARVPVVGRTKVAALITAFRQRFWPGTRTEWVEVNGHPGVLILRDDEPLGLLTAQVSADGIEQLQWHLTPTKIAAFLRSADRFS